jgi:hypothetical protein
MFSADTLCGKGGWRAWFPGGHSVSGLSGSRAGLDCQLGIRSIRVGDCGDLGIRLTARPRWTVRHGG